MPVRHVFALARGVRAPLVACSALALLQRLAIPAAALALAPGSLTAFWLLALAFVLSRARGAFEVHVTRRLTPLLLQAAARRVLARPATATPEVQEERAMMAIAVCRRFFAASAPMLAGDLLALPIVAVLAFQVLGTTTIPLGLGAGLALVLVLASWRVLRRRWAAVEARSEVAAAWLAAAVRGGAELRPREIRARYLANLGAHGETWGQAEARYERGSALAVLVAIALGAGVALGILVAAGHSPSEIAQILSGRGSPDTLRAALVVGATIPILVSLPRLIVEAFQLSRFAADLEPGDPVAGRGGGAPWPADAATLSLDAVSMRYGEHPALDGVTLALPLSGVTAIVGCNGAGKSTLARLLTGHLLPSSGTIRVGDVPLAAIDAELVARAAVLVPQTPALIESLTLAENVRLVVPDATDAQIAAVLAEVGLALPLSQPLGEASRGEQRRVALARTLLRRPSLLVLDEPDAWLDAAGRRALTSALRAAAARCAVIVVTHRADLVSWVDRVLVLGRDHRLADLGSPAELAERSEEFRALLSSGGD